jgi:quinohemoprotein ethanol dehydrogenase
VYVGTGQPGPWTDVHRGKGDALCTDCIIAVRGATGQYVWHYQTTPNDNWDYDSIADIMLADLNINGRERKVLMHAPKNGFFYVLDRKTGELLSAEPWVTVSWSSGVNMLTGRPTVNPEANYGTDSVSGETIGQLIVSRQLIGLFSQLVGVLRIVWLDFLRLMLQQGNFGGW